MKNYENMMNEIDNEIEQHRKEIVEEIGLIERDYKLIASPNIEALEKIVRSYVMNGWKPSGPLHIITSDTGMTTMIQAIILEPA